MPDINDLLKNINKTDLQAAVKKAQEFSKTAEGQALVNRIKKSGGTPDQKEIMKAIEKNPDFIKKLNDLL